MMDARSSTIRDAPTRVTNRNTTGRVPEPSARRGGRRDRPVVLVVEDDADDREIYGRILYYNGFDVIFADDAAGAIELACSHGPDLILLDLGLPTGSGLDVCAELRRRSVCADTPVIALSGFPEAEMGARARQAGCSQYIEKPASPVVVLHAVEAMIGKAPLPGEGRPPVVVE
jgi:two-component system, OmpR family, phosphate regulon response regulator PhoB